MENSKVIDSFYNVDYSDLKMPIIAVFYNTLDFPNTFVARLFDLQSPTNLIVVDDTLEGIRSKIPNIFTVIPRSKEDHETVVESWL